MKARIRLSYEMFIDCPYCDKTIDLTDQDYNDECFYSQPIFENRWGDLKGEKVICSECEREFEIEDVDL